MLLAIDPALASRIFVNNGNFFINADLGLSLQALAGAKGLYDRPFWVGLSLNVGLEFMLSKERNNAIEVGINFSNGGVFGGLSATVGYKFGK